MTHSKLKERFAQRGQIRAIDRVSSGSSADLVLRPLDATCAVSSVRPIDAALALAKRGLTLLKAKRVVEAAIDAGHATVCVPTVEDLCALAADLQRAGLDVKKVACEPVDVRSIRETLGLTQEQFALRFNLDVDTVRNWEQKRHAPDRASMSYLRVIAKLPLAAAAAQEESVP